jgi:hypothetical protein
MWDAKRQAIWLTTAIILATLVVYREARDENGFDFGYFALLELIFLAVIVIMFYIYSRNSNK